MLFVIALMVSMFASTALAASEDDEDEVNLEDILIPIPIVVTHEHETRPLTPPGNLTLVDDSFVETIDEKQFMTVVTKNGNYFYIVVDRDGNTENVHFLNLVDEMDLIALLEDDFEMPEKPQPEPYVPLQVQEPEPEPEPEPEKKGNNGLLVLIIFLAIGGIGAAVYFKVIKPKQAMSNSGNFTSVEEISFNENELDSDYQENEGYDEDDEEEEDDEPEEPKDESNSEEFEPDNDEEEDEDDGEYV